ncbi:2411_t:CDS:2 [Racocetra fulgida]|uniref:2411_t:CDS:1 n=1 Tax=Racocetra fulgida TaxID=60492 RepID=A0A9N9DS16_9GLOM|nr:2411_t:CDS:2 [Racocetra fulgida]
MLDIFMDAPRVSTVQALILLCMVDQGKPTSYRPQTYSSMAIRMAQSMGLNRRNGTVYQGKVDRLNSLATGDPLAINDKMCDIELPSPDEIDDQDDDQQQSPQQQNPHSSTYAQQINIFVNFIRLARLIAKAAKVHEINIASSHRGLAIPSYRNILKTIKICQFYQQNNIMTELASQTIKALENIVIKYQEKFTNEDNPQRQR